MHPRAKKNDFPQTRAPQFWAPPEACLGSWSIPEALLASSSLLAWSRLLQDQANPSRATATKRDNSQPTPRSPPGPSGRPRNLKTLPPSDSRENSRPSEGGRVLRFLGRPESLGDERGLACELSRLVAVGRDRFARSWGSLEQARRLGGAQKRIPGTLQQPRNAPGAAQN